MFDLAFCTWWRGPMRIKVIVTKREGEKSSCTPPSAVERIEPMVYMFWALQSTCCNRGTPSGRNTAPPSSKLLGWIWCYLFPLDDGEDDHIGKRSCCCCCCGLGMFLGPSTSREDGDGAQLPREQGMRVGASYLPFCHFGICGDEG